MPHNNWQSPGVRRIVTAHDPRGLGGIRSDDVLKAQVRVGYHPLYCLVSPLHVQEHPLMKGVRTGTIWATESIPTKDNNVVYEYSFRCVPVEPDTFRTEKTVLPESRRVIWDWCLPAVHIAW